MAIYSKQVVHCLKKHFKHLSVVSPDTKYQDDTLELIRVPSYLSITPKLSKIRPILWLLYAYLFFPKNRGHILSTTHHTIPRSRKQIVTIHDLRPFFYPDNFLQKFYFRYLLPRTVRKIDGILTVSQSTKELLIKYYKIEPERIQVVHNCVDVTRFKPIDNAKKSKEEPYLLMVGASWKHKNAHEVLAMNRYWQDRYHLKILAGNGKYKQQLIELSQKYGLTDKVEFIDYLNENELISLYQRAEALIYPSIMEGFGIPPIEAMACQVPVIVSDIPVFRENYADAPIYVTLNNQDSWRIAFEHLTNKDYMEERIKLGQQKSQEYSKERMCNELFHGITKIWPGIKEEEL
jgi:glycosyltransferase involved in cell wall biosynthesis